MNNLTYSDFSDRFVVYNNIIFFIFQLENLFERSIDEDEFQISFSSSCSIDFNGKKYYYPFDFKNCGKVKFMLNEVIEKIGKVPLFNINLNGQRMINLGMSRRIALRNENLYIKQIKEAEEIINSKIIVHMDVDDYDDISDNLIKLFDSCGIEYENHKKYLIIDDAIITKIPNILIPKEIVKDKNIIYEDFRYLYYSSLKNERIISLGYFNFKNNFTIDLNPIHHLAIFNLVDNSIIDILE